MSIGKRQAMTNYFEVCDGAALMCSFAIIRIHTPYH
jgi:hypothetical protein